MTVVWFSHSISAFFEPFSVRRRRKRCGNDSVDRERFAETSRFENAFSADGDLKREEK